MREFLWGTLGVFAFIICFALVIFFGLGIVSGFMVLVATGNLLIIPVLIILLFLFSAAFYACVLLFGSA